MPLRAHSEAVTIPPPQGFVSDFARVIDSPTRQQLTHLIQELKDKTGAEIAVVTVETTQPLTDFDYAMKIAETWKPGAKGKDNGVVFLVATKDRKVRVLTGYGVEGVLPDGRVGAIQDQYIVPHFKQGNYSKGILAGTQVMADLIAQEYGVTLTGVPTRVRQQEEPLSTLVLFLFAFILLALILSAFTGTGRSRYTRFRSGRYPGGGFGGGGFGGGGFGGRGGGFEGGGGGFGGFGGGESGGGGAGRDW